MTMRFKDLSNNAIFRYKGRQMRKDGNRAWAYPFQTSKYPWFFNGPEIVEKIDEIPLISSMSIWTLNNYL